MSTSNSGLTAAADDDGQPLKGLKILAVDNNESDLMHLQALLLQLGSQVITCHGHDEAISLFREGGHQFDAVVADIDWDIGFEFVKLVHREMNLPIFVTLSRMDIAIVVAAMENGAVFGFMKPLEIEKLCRIKSYVDEHKSLTYLRNRESVSSGKRKMRESDEEKEKSSPRAGENRRRGGGRLTINEPTADSTGSRDNARRDQEWEESVPEAREESRGDFCRAKRDWPLDNSFEQGPSNNLEEPPTDIDMDFY